MLEIKVSLHSPIVVRLSFVTSTFSFNLNVRFDRCFIEATLNHLAANELQQGEFVPINTE